jgi:hypothetical protein
LEKEARGKMLKLDVREAILVSQIIQSIVSGDLGIGKENLTGHIVLASLDSPFPSSSEGRLSIRWDPDFIYITHIAEKITIA